MSSEDSSISSLKREVKQAKMAVASAQRELDSMCGGCSDPSDQAHMIEWRKRANEALAKRKQELESAKANLAKAEAKKKKASHA